MNDFSQHSSDAPQLRTLLLTDLCDSTSLVERLGDNVAAELFREHDRLVLQLQQQWRGRLIDRSDGLLLLFERPIDGLGFALDYGHGLRALGHAHQQALLTRTGLHVGEVLTWRNSDEAVRVGAKPLEVEGLAKPTAARLMSMARPGQILLSAVAEPLAHRAARELGERGLSLTWKSHGRWHFKGMPSTQEVFEVGEPGIAPLRAPPNSPKAWRDIPLWRRPAALGAEVALLAGIGIGAWFVTRPQPAIAFNQRDWVVVADLRNLTGDQLLDDSLEQAFRISLEQSRYVNVLSDLKTRDTLGRMQLKPGTPLDRATASEVAVRDGARAVILPTVSEVGGRVRVSAEVVDPHTQTTVYAESADGTGAVSALDSIDTVTAALRGKLGEAIKSIEKDSAPLPQVTTQSLDALRAYALGNAAFGRAQWSEALQLYRRAVSIDPKFALAHLAMSRVYVALSDRRAAVPYLDRALALKARLPPRDRLYLDAWESELRIPGQVLPRWKLLAAMYPDYIAGQGNASWHSFVLNDFEQARRYGAAADIEQSPMRAIALDQLGRIELAQGKPLDAIANFKKANARQAGVSSRRLAAALAVQGRHEQALATIESMVRSGFASDDPIRYIDLVTLAADQGHWRTAEMQAANALRAIGASSPGLARQFALIKASLASIAHPGKNAEKEYGALLGLQLAALDQPDNPKVVDDAFAALVAAYLAQRDGHDAVAVRALAALKRWETPLAGTVFAKMLVVVRAEHERLAGRPEAALRLLTPALDGTELVQARVAARAAAYAAGRHELALNHARWLLDHRGRAYMEANAAQTLQTLNVVDARLARLHAAEALMTMKKAGPAAENVKTFLDVWPYEQLPGYLRRRAEVILPASKQ